MTEGSDGKTLWAEDLTETIGVVVGTRPGIIKQSPIIRELQKRECPFIVLHTGQHYSPEMDRSFFDDLELPQPDYRLTEPSKLERHGAQTAEMLKGVEEILLEERPRAVLVHGDANSNLAAALAARKLHIPIAHIEAGVRSYDWRMPEEHNRIMIDHISELLFTPSQQAEQQLQRECVRGQTFVVGNTIVDAVLQHEKLAQQSSVLSAFGLEGIDYAVLTLHREENVDRPATLTALLDAVAKFSRESGVRVAFPVHPRTQRRIEQFGLSDLLNRATTPLPPLGYMDFLRLLSNSRLLLTDSGGGQQEACILRIPCVTLRPSTEWVETVAIGANRLAGQTAERVVAEAERMLDAPRTWPNPFGDEGAARRIVEVATRPVEAPGLPGQGGSGSA